jgi:hypothetical protein
MQVDFMKGSIAPGWKSGAAVAGCFRAGNSGRQIALAGNFGY